MGLVNGTNCGFVTSAPTADPEGAGTTGCDNYAWAMRDTAPAGAVRVTKIGWYCTNATQEANFEVGIYEETTDYPGDAVGSLSQTNAKGVGAGWKSASVDISITAGTDYWIAVQIDDTESTTHIDTASSVGDLRAYKSAQTELTDPFVSGGSTDEVIQAIYAVYEVADTRTRTEILTG